MEKGEILGLLGPNGAGKTTTIRMIVGLMSRTKGLVRINGLDTVKMFKEAMRHVGVIVENPDLYKYLSGYDNLLHFARMTPNVSRSRMKEVVELVGLTDRISDKVATYSLGMRQRLGLAVVLVHRPSLLILDEPTNGLDPSGIRELRNHLKDIANQDGVGVLVSSHLISEMEMMCDRVVILEKGRLVGNHLLANLSGQENSLISFEVDRTDLAMQLLQAIMNGVDVTIQRNHVQIVLNKSQIPEVSRELMDAGIKVYGVSIVKKTLEDTFLEITGGERL